MSSRNVKHLVAVVWLLSLFTTYAQAVIVELDGHPTMNQINVNQRPPWDSIPDIEFRCQNIIQSSNDEINLIVSHKNKEIYVNDKPFAAISESTPVYTNQINQFGNYEVMIYISLVRGPGWELTAFQNPIYFVLSAKNVFYKRI